MWSGGRSRQPRTPRFAHRLFIEYDETQRDRTRMVQPPPKSNLLIRAINRERSSTSKKVEVQKPVSQVRILPGAQCGVSGHCRGHSVFKQVKVDFWPPAGTLDAPGMPFGIRRSGASKPPELLSTAIRHSWSVAASASPNAPVACVPDYLRNRMTRRHAARPDARRRPDH
jgi:hypothetical protein